MTNSMRHIALVLCLAAGYGCSRSPEVPLLPTYRGDIGGNVPAVRGQLVVNERGCVALHMEGSSKTLPLVWPRGYSMQQADDDTWNIVNDEGAFSLPVGSMVSVGVKRVTGTAARELSPGEAGSRCLQGESLVVEAVPVPE